MANESVSTAEVEKFRIERSAEKVFIAELSQLVKTFEAKVSSKNGVLRSMQRFLKANV